MLPLSDSTSLLAVWRRQLHRGEYTETQRMWKLQGTVLQNKDVFLVILASENLYKTKNFYFMQFSEAQFPFPVCLNSTPYCWLLNATKRDATSTIFLKHFYNKSVMTTYERNCENHNS